MATHDVVITLPLKEILYKDVVIEVSTNDDRLGMLAVSRVASDGCLRTHRSSDTSPGRNLTR